MIWHVTRSGANLACVPCGPVNDQAKDQPVLLATSSDSARAWGVRAVSYMPRAECEWCHGHVMVTVELEYVP